MAHHSCLVGTGIGVSIAPACVQHITWPESVCIPLRGVDVLSQVEIAWRKGDRRPMIEHFVPLARKQKALHSATTPPLRKRK